MAKHYTIKVEIWSNTRRTWAHLRFFQDRISAEQVVRNWERDGYRARIVEREFSNRPDFVNHRGE